MGDIGERFPEGMGELDFKHDAESRRENPEAARAKDAARIRDVAAQFPEEQPKTPPKLSTSHESRLLSDSDAQVQAFGSRVSEVAQGKLVKPTTKSALKKEISKEKEEILNRRSDEQVAMIESVADRGFSSLEKAIREKEKFFGSKTNVYDNLAEAIRNQKELQRLAAEAKPSENRNFFLEKAEKLGRMIKQAGKLYNLSTSVDFDRYWSYRADRSIVGVGERQGFIASLRQALSGKGGLERYIDGVVEEGALLSGSATLHPSVIEAAEVGVIDGFKELQQAIREVEKNPKQPGPKAIKHFMNAQARLDELQGKLAKATLELTLSKDEHAILQQLADHLERTIHHVREQHNPIKLTPRERDFIEDLHQQIQLHKNDPEKLQKVIAQKVNAHLLNTVKKLADQALASPVKKGQVEEEHSKAVGQLLMKFKALALMGLGQDLSLESALEIHTSLAPVIHAIESVLPQAAMSEIAKAQQRITTSGLKDYVLNAFAKDFPSPISKGKIDQQEFQQEVNHFRQLFTSPSTLEDAWDFVLEGLAQYELTPSQKEEYDKLVNEFSGAFKKRVDRAIQQLGKSADEAVIQKENTELERIFSIVHSLPQKMQDKLSTVFFAKKTLLIEHGLKYGIHLPDIVFGRPLPPLDRATQQAIETIIRDKDSSEADKEKALAQVINSPSAQAYAVGQQIKALLKQKPTFTALAQAKSAIRKLELWIKREREIPGHEGLADAMKRNILDPERTNFQLAKQEIVSALSRAEEQVASAENPGDLLKANLSQEIQSIQLSSQFSPTVPELRAHEGFLGLQKAIAAREEGSDRGIIYEHLKQALQKHKELQDLAKTSPIPEVRALALAKAEKLSKMIKQTSTLYEFPTSVDYARYWSLRTDRGVIDTAERRARHEGLLGERLLGKGGIELYIDDIVEQDELLSGSKAVRSPFDIAEAGAISGFRELKNAIAAIRENPNPEKSSPEAIKHFMNAQAYLLELQDKIKDPKLSDPERTLLRQIAGHLERTIRHVKDEYNLLKLTENEKYLIKGIYESTREGVKSNPEELQRRVEAYVLGHIEITHTPHEEAFILMGQLMMKLKSLALMGPSQKESSPENAKIQAYLVPVIHDVEKIFSREQMPFVEAEQQIGVPVSQKYGVPAAFVRNFPTVIRGKTELSGDKDIDKFIIENRSSAPLIIRRGLKYGINIPDKIFGDKINILDDTKLKRIRDIIWSTKLSPQEKEDQLVQAIDSSAAQAYAMGEQIRVLLGQVTPSGGLTFFLGLGKTPFMGGSLPGSQALVQAKFAIERLEAWVEREKDIPGHAGLAAAVRQEILTPRKKYFELVADNEAVFALSQADQRIAHEIYNATSPQDILKALKLPPIGKALSAKQEKEAVSTAVRILHQMEARVLTDPTNKQKYLAEIYGLKRQLVMHMPELYTKVVEARIGNAASEETIQQVKAFEQRYGQQSMWAHFFDSCDWALKNLKTYPERATAILVNNANLLREGRKDPDKMIQAVIADERRVVGDKHRVISENLTETDRSDVIGRANGWMRRIKSEAADFIYLPVPEARIEEGDKFIFTPDEIVSHLSGDEQMVLGHLVGEWDITGYRQGEQGFDIDTFITKGTPGVIKRVIHAAIYHQKLPVLLPGKEPGKESRIEFIEARKLVVKMNGENSGLFQWLKEQYPKDRELLAILESAERILEKEIEGFKAEERPKQELEAEAIVLRAPVLEDQQAALSSQPASSAAKRPALSENDRLMVELEFYRPFVLKQKPVQEKDLKNIYDQALKCRDKGYDVGARALLRVIQESGHNYQTDEVNGLLAELEAGQPMPKSKGDAVLSEAEIKAEHQLDPELTKKADDLVRILNRLNISHEVKKDYINKLILAKIEGNDSFKLVIKNVEKLISKHEERMKLDHEAAALMIRLSVLSDESLKKALQIELNQAKKLDDIVYQATIESIANHILKIELEDRANQLIKLEKLKAPSSKIIEQQLAQAGKKGDVTYKAAIERAEKEALLAELDAQAKVLEAQLKSIEDLAELKDDFIHHLSTMRKLVMEDLENIDSYKKAVERVRDEIFKAQGLDKVVDGWDSDTSKQIEIDTLNLDSPKWNNERRGLIAEEFFKAIPDKDKLRVNPESMKYVGKMIWELESTKFEKETVSKRLKILKEIFGKITTELVWNPAKTSPEVIAQVTAYAIIKSGLSESVCKRVAQLYPAAVNEKNEELAVLAKAMRLAIDIIEKPEEAEPAKGRVAERERKIEVAEDEIKESQQHSVPGSFFFGGIDEAEESQSERLDRLEGEAVRGLKPDDLAFVLSLASKINAKLRAVKGGIMHESDKQTFYILGLHYLSQGDGITAEPYLRKLLNYKNSDKLLNEIAEAQERIKEAQKKPTSPELISQFLRGESEIRRLLKQLSDKAGLLQMKLKLITGKIDDVTTKLKQQGIADSEKQKLQEQQDRNSAEYENIMQQIEELPKKKPTQEAQLHKQLREFWSSLGDEYAAQTPATRENLTKAYEYYSSVIEALSAAAAKEEGAAVKEEHIKKQEEFIEKRKVVFEQLRILNQRENLVNDYKHYSLQIYAASDPAVKKELTEKRAEVLEQLKSLNS